MNGYVRKIFQEKGFAFIEGEDERDYFLHWSKVLRSSVPFRNMKEGERVSFDVEEGTNGPKALNVLVIRKEKTNGGTHNVGEQRGSGLPEAAETAREETDSTQGQPFNSALGQYGERREQGGAG